MSEPYAPPAFGPEHPRWRRWSGDVYALDGLAWYQHDPPPADHEHAAVMVGWPSGGLDMLQRCACGAARYNLRPWFTPPGERLRTVPPQPLGVAPPADDEVVRDAFDHPHRRDDRPVYRPPVPLVMLGLLLWGVVLVVAGAFTSEPAPEWSVWLFGAGIACAVPAALGLAVYEIRRDARERRNGNP